MEDKEASNSKGTPTKKARRVCHYNVDWESRFVWLNKCDEDNTKGYCKLCKNSFTVAYDGLKAVTHHAEAKKHKECESAAAMSHRMKSFFTPKGSAQNIVKQITGGRTKCTALVNQVLFPYSMELVQEDLKNDVPFSVATDASNNVNRKFFPVAIQYFSPKSGICHKILDFYEDSFEDSTSIKERLCEAMDKS
ncbi:dimer_Tnp_hAT domain-containing protein [Trichonephila clavipes]|nr:dimer_Tnp_hAT domain-containing protein [Trichonephila clavipes]